MKKTIPEKRCENCIHFIQHYGKVPGSENHYFAIFCGHCICMRIKSRTPHTPACQHYSPREKESCWDRQEK